jgi:hypothetical protein
MPMDERLGPQSSASLNISVRYEDRMLMTRGGSQATASGMRRRRRRHGRRGAARDGRAQQGEMTGAASAASRITGWSTSPSSAAGSMVPASRATPPAAASGPAKGDLAETSSRSGKLVHGRLRYLDIMSASCARR